MFPFNLPGPAFLIFYTALGIALGLLNAWQLRRRRVSLEADHTKTLFNAPYSLAYLNQGQDHCLSICAFNLIDRGLMTTNDTGQISSRAGDTKQVSHPLEHALMQYAAAGNQPLFTALSNSKVKAAIRAIKTQLTEQGLMARSSLFSPFKLACLAILGAVAAIKIVLALSHGHTNIQWLILLSIVFTCIICLTQGPNRTAEGNATLEIMRGLLAQLHSRMQELKPGGFTQEAALAAALFGLSSLSLEWFPYLKAITPPIVDTSASSGDGGSGSGNSCSSSCSSCGGGGCGGCGS
ncbi:MAG: TIGR04222 domain-containing membrane protein [Marinagarivorans sp.]